MIDFEPEKQYNLSLKYSGIVDLAGDSASIDTYASNFNYIKPTPTPTPIEDSHYLVTENEHVKLYSSLPLQDGKFDPTSDLVVEVKDGYSLSQKIAFISIKHANNGKEIMSNLMFPYMEQVGRLCTLYFFTSSNSLKYGVDYDLVLYNLIHNDNADQIVEKSILTASTIGYTGDSQPLLFSEFNDLKLVAGTIGSGYSMYRHIYHPYKLTTSYDISVSDTSVISASYLSDLDFLRINALKASSVPVIVTITATDTDGKTLTTSFSVEVIDNPIELDYCYNHIRVNLINGFGVKYDDLGDFTFDYSFNTRYNQEDKFIVKDLVFLDNTVEDDKKIVTGFNIYLSNANGEIINFEPEKQYNLSLKYRGNIVNLAGDSASIDTYASNFNYIKPTQDPLLENDYFVLYSDLPLEDGKVATDGALIVESKNDYLFDVNDYAMFLKYFGIENYTGYLAKPNIPDIFYRIVFEDYSYTVALDSTNKITLTSKTDQADWYTLEVNQQEITCTHSSGRMIKFNISVDGDTNTIILTPVL